MKLLFSEHKSNYDRYQFPYAIWAVPEPGETPAELFNAGFLPSSRNLDRFYLCRQIRVNQSAYKPGTENRRILRKGAQKSSKCNDGNRSQSCLNFHDSSRKWRMSARGLVKRKKTFTATGG